MDINDKYRLDEKLLERIADRVQKSNGDPDADMILALAYSIYGHLREMNRQVICLKKNPMVWIGQSVKDYPVLSAFVGLCVLIVIILAHDPANFQWIANMLSGDITLPPTLTPTP